MTTTETAQTFHAIYYYPDGYGNREKVEFEGTFGECLAYVRDQIGSDFGEWTDENGDVGYHESAEEGCGGYMISKAGRTV